MKTRKRLRELELRVFHLENPLKYEINKEYRYIWLGDKTRSEKTLTILNYEIEPETEYHPGNIFNITGGEKRVDGHYRRRYSVLFNDHNGNIWSRELTEAELKYNRCIFEIKPKKKKK